MAIDTRGLTFYHGTSAEAARSILRDGYRDVFDEMGWRAMATEVWSAILSLGTEQEMRSKYLTHPDLLRGTGWRTLRSAASNEKGSVFSYGSFFATLHIGHGYQYAVRNPCRSEFLLAIAHGLEFLKRCQAGLPAARIEGDHPALSGLINNPPPPVVLELVGIENYRIRNEDGTSEIAPRIERYLNLAHSPDLEKVASYWILDVVPRDLIAVHDLREWKSKDVQPPPWRPTDEQVRGVRKNVKEWLAFNGRSAGTTPSSWIA